MTLTDEEKKAAIAAKRGPLEHELYTAELDLKTAEASGDDALVEEPKARVERIKGQLKVLDDEEKKVG
jgi:hypothetical protein